MTIKTFIAKNRIALGVIAAALVLGGIYWYVNSATAPSFDSYAAAKGNVVQTVDEPATVLAENNANVSFQEGGQIAHVYVKEGQQVGAGTVLADLDAAQYNTSVAQAQAALAAAQAQLAQLQAGTRSEQLQIDESSVASADQTLGIAVQGAYSAADDAVRNQLDNLFTNTQTSNPTFTVPNSNSQLITNITSERLSLGVALGQWYSALSATSTDFDRATLAGTAANDLQQVNSYIDQISLVVNAATPGGQLTASTITAYKGYVAASRAEIQGAITAIAQYQSALTSAKNTLTLAKAGATTEQLQAQQAAVAQAQAALQSAQVGQGRASLIAPFSGAVSNLTAQVGQVVAPGAPVMALVNNSGLKIQAYASQADVAKIVLGDKANITLDAFGTGTTFPATVSTIDAAETMVNGAPAYLVTLHFTNTQPQIKDGMAGNAHVVIGEHDDVIVVPSKLVIKNANNYFVLTQNGAVQSERPVTIGLQGDDGMTEIASGLNVGDKINTF